MLSVRGGSLPSALEQSVTVSGKRCGRTPQSGDYNGGFPRLGHRPIPLAPAHTCSAAVCVIQPFFRLASMPCGSTPCDALRALYILDDTWRSSCMVIGAAATARRPQRCRRPALQRATRRRRVLLPGDYGGQPCFHARPLPSAHTCLSSGPERPSTSSVSTKTNGRRLSTPPADTALIAGLSGAFAPALASIKAPTSMVKHVDQLTGGCGIHGAL
ncbi:hypothetical protein E2C01_032688 [Portunus trituberculatus]|uniref:Uncharacterized protein n=1 Tax=Portunus trituberculatus TaxID=210409 RepID=A0A5B7F097_PORTR|nr:hypothetical protein [Portunus trituberculatus]